MTRQLTSAGPMVYVTWPTCDREDGQGEPCIGRRVEGFDQCLAHLDSDQLDEVMSRLCPGVDIDFRGTVISGELFARLQSAVVDNEHRPIVNNAYFDRAAFTDATIWTKFTGDAHFQGATFDGTTLFFGACFEGDAEFINATFGAEVRFMEVSVDGDADFHHAKIDTTGSWIELAVAGVLIFYRAVFTAPLMIDASAVEVSLDHANFEAGATLLLDYAVVSLERAEFGATSTLSAKGVGVIADQYNEEWVNTLKQISRVRSPTPMLTSLKGVDVTNILLSGIDMGPCWFDGAHHLDKIRLEGICQFRRPPKGNWAVPCWPWGWRWDSRRIIAEEHDWRRTTRKNSGWFDNSQDGLYREDDPDPKVLSPRQLAGIYRQLRKAQEDSKNEPGAADFYYGEMEMRRHDPEVLFGERFILHLYWFVSGYGLRSMRAVGFLAGLIVISAIVFWGIGFNSATPSIGLCLLYVTESAVSLEAKLAPFPSISWQGEIVRLFMRLMGPVLLGLSILAIRNRVKR